MRIRTSDVVALSVIGLSAATAVMGTVVLRNASIAAEQANAIHFEAVTADAIERESREHGHEGATVVRIRGDAGVVGQSEIRIRRHEGESSRVIRIDRSVEPLIYVDGVRMDGGMPGDLSPDQIDRVEVVKGDAATELFGEEAAGGVVQIFLKTPAAETPGR